MADDLSALPIAGLIRRITSGGNGPRGLALSPDGKRIYAANYFSGTIGVIDVETGGLRGAIAMGPQPAAQSARRGEIYFHDAMRCFQHWHSCASCHFEGRVDGLTWDFLRDGVGNGKDVISLVGMIETSPYNRRATRAAILRECLRTGVVASHGLLPEPNDVDDLLAYVSSLWPRPARPPDVLPMRPSAAKCFLKGRPLAPVAIPRRGSPTGRCTTWGSFPRWNPTAAIRRRRWWNVTARPPITTMAAPPHSKRRWPTMVAAANTAMPAGSGPRNWRIC